MRGAADMSITSCAEVKGHGSRLLCPSPHDSPKRIEERASSGGGQWFRIYRAL
jgi:hypothetical protein